MCNSNFIFIFILIAIVVLWIICRKKILRLVDKAISKSIYYQLLLLVVSIIAAFGILLLFMLAIHDEIKLQMSDWILSFINPGSTFSSGAIGDPEKVWAIIVGVIGMIIMGGLLISIFSNILERRVDKLKNGQVHYAFKNHVVIIGYDRMSIGLIGQLAKDERFKNSKIILQTTQEVSKVRHELFALLETKIEKKVIILSGNCTSCEDLTKLHVERCKVLFILGENDEYDNDSLNIECIRIIYAILAKQIIVDKIRCHVLFEYQSTYAVYQREDLFRLKDRIDFFPFNFYEMWAQKVFVDRTYDCQEKDKISEKLTYTPLDREGIKADSEQKVQLVVIGMSSMGVALGVQAAHLCHFPNFVTKGIKTRITFIDEHADREMNFLWGRYQHLFNETDIYYREVKKDEMFADGIMNKEVVKINPPASKETFTDLEFEFIKARVEYPVIQRYLAGLSCKRDIYMTIAICFYFPPKALAAGLYLPNEIYSNNIPVLVQQEMSYCTLDMLSKEGKYRNVKPFGMLDNCYDLKKADDLIPMMVKYMYDETCKKDETGEMKMAVIKNFPPDVMRKCWDNWIDLKGKESRNITALKWSNIYHANMTQVKKRSLNILPGQELSVEQINLLARVEHNRWNIEKLLMGYRPCTPEEVDDIACRRKTKQELRDDFIHNDIRPYEALSKDDHGIQANEYDVNISRALPFMLSELEKMNNDSKN